MTDDRDPLWRQLQSVLGKVDPVPPQVLQDAHDAFAEMSPADPEPTERGSR